MSGQLTEGEINTISDLFQAFKLMQQLDVNPRGVANLEDAKCRLLQYIQEKYGAGFHSHANAAEMMQEVLQKDARSREKLGSLYQSALQFVSRIPPVRAKEMQKGMPGFEAVMKHNMDSIRKSDCGILVAGEVSAGKSSLLNLLLGQELLPTSLLSCTSVMCELKHSTTKRAVAHPWDESKKPERIDLSSHDPMDVLAEYVHQKGDRSKRFPYKRVEIFWPFPLLQGGIFVVDSPGIGESREMTEMVKQYLPSAFAFIYVINSSNAGGLQPDRIQDLLASLVKHQDDLSVFDPRSAIFVCNKWDQVPSKEEELVRKDTIEKLTRCWSGLDESQVFYMSTIKAAKSLKDSGYTTQDFSLLLKGIENLLPISLQCKLENHYRWLSQLLRRMAFHLRVYIANETRSDEDRKELTEHLHHQLDKLDSESKRVNQDLKLELQKRANAACDQLIAHLASASTRARLMHWDDCECPDGDDWDLLQEILMAKVNKRIRHEVNDWDTKNCIFMEIQIEMIQKFQEEFELMEDQLSIVEGRMMGGGARVGDTMSYMRTLPRQQRTPLLTTKQKIALGIAAPILLPLGIVAGMVVLPIAGARALRSKLQDMKLVKEYRKNKAQTLAVMTDEILENFLERSNLTKLIQEQLRMVTQNVDSMIQSIPNLLEADRIMLDKLQEEREATEESLAKKYFPLSEKCFELEAKLNFFYCHTVRKYDIEFADLQWDAAKPPIASGSYGDVYIAMWVRKNETRDVAIKIRRTLLNECNVSDIISEEDNLRRLKHENIVDYYGTCCRRGDNVETLQLILVMELCDTTLQSRINGPHAKNPGKLAGTFALFHEAVRTVARYATQLCSALTYLHERGLVHRDLKPQNILINREDVIKLADVGLTKCEQDISGTKCGTTCYAAPEVLESAEYDKSADIYSLGMIVWELWYGRLAQDELTQFHKGDIESAIRAGARPSLTRIHEPDEDWKSLLRRCWAHNSKKRLSAPECYTFFSKLI